jgi:aryl-alcohol dehydrogenase-like predicted oxidoreductase
MTASDQAQSRREFLKVSALTPLALAAAPGIQLAQNAAQPKPDAPDKVTALPKRPLGKTGVDVTILNLGGMMGAHSPQYLDMAWSMGIRYFDTADCYIGGKSEQNVAQWLKRYPERRKELFLVTKDHPRGGPQELLKMIDTRLERCGTDYIDLFFIHGLGPKEYSGALDWPKNAELKAVAEQLKKSGKVKLFGFSCHDGQAPQMLQAAAEGGFIDAIMVAYNPFMNPTDELNRALDACAKAGIGLVSMKEMRALGEVPKRLPEFDKLGLTTHQAVLHAVWSDERIASICSNIENTQQMTENTQAARSYKTPLALAYVQLLRETALACRPSMCPNCDGRCARAAGAEHLPLNDLARFVTYYEREGDLSARELYQALAEEHRLAKGADLEAAQHACLCNLDFAAIVKKAERYFA